MQKLRFPAFMNWLLMFSETTLDTHIDFIDIFYPHVLTSYVQSDDFSELPDIQTGHIQMSYPNLQTADEQWYYISA